jgi:alkylated DNA repair dioxygenase AlkB
MQTAGAQARKRRASELAAPAAAPAPDRVLRLGGDALDARLDVWDPRHCLPRGAALDAEVAAVTRALAGRARLQFSMFGEPRTMRRRQAFYALDPAVAEYRFSGAAVAAEAAAAVPPLVRRCIDFANARYGGGFNAALCNLYDDGSDYISQHSDDEAAHAPGSAVLTFSFGAERRMRFAAKPAARKLLPHCASQSVQLPHAGCVVMRGQAFQRCFTHGIPKVAARAAADTPARLSVTVRKFARHPR